MNSSFPDNNNSPKQPTKTAKIMEEIKKIPARQIILDVVLLYSCGKVINFSFWMSLENPGPPPGNVIYE